MALEGLEGEFKIGGRLLTNLRYADDMLIANTEAELQEIVTRLYWAACELSMKINVMKTEVMKLDDDLTPMKITVAGGNLRQVHSFQISVHTSTLTQLVLKKLNQDWQLGANVWPN